MNNQVGNTGLCEPLVQIRCQYFEMVNKLPLKDDLIL